MAYLVKNIATKVLKRDEDDETLTFAIKADVTNKTDDEDVYLTLQGLDADGFEVYNISISGRIPCNATKTLTTKEDYVAFSDYDAVVFWQPTD
jgi:hypothetical protein